MVDGTTLIIIFGLTLDVCGAFLIVRPLLKYRIFKMGFVDYYNESEDKKFKSIGFEEGKKLASQAWFGFGLLGTGFFLQMIGNYFR